MRHKKNLPLRKGILIALPLLGEASYEATFERRYPPLALGYLKSAARQKGLLSFFDIEIWGEDKTSLLGDRHIADLVCGEHPDFVGFSCYCWNLKRVFLIAKLIKKFIPDCTILVGGPEITPDNSAVVNCEHLDYLVFGEGEETFCEFLELLLNKKHNAESIPGLGFWKNGKRHFTEKRDLIRLENYPSPYLTGDISIKGLSSLPIEIVRGCPFRCSYCHYGDNVVRYRPIDVIMKEFLLAKKYNIPEVYLLAPSFNAISNFKEICEQLSKLNSDRRQQIFVELRADLLTPKDAELLSMCNVIEAGIGLQTITMNALNNINRCTDPKRFLIGLKALRAKGIRVLLDMIVGLPGDNLDTIAKTVKFLIQSGENFIPLCYWLCVLPDTALRRRAKEFGIEYRNTPPYYVTKTGWMSNDDLKKAMYFVRKCFIGDDVQNKAVPLPLLIDHSKGPDISQAINPTTETTARSKGYVKRVFQHSISNGALTPNENKQIMQKMSINKLILDLDNFIENDKLFRYSQDYHFASYMMLWLKAFDITKHKKSIAQISKYFVENNPNTVWDLVLESYRPVNCEDVSWISEKLLSKGHYLDHPLLGGERLYNRFGGPVRSYILAKWDICTSRKWPVDELIKKYFFIWNINIAGRGLRLDTVNYLLNCTKCDGLHVDFDGTVSNETTLYTLDQLANITKRKAIRFRNWALQNLWNSHYNYRSINDRDGRYDLILDMSNNIDKFIFLDKSIYKDTYEWHQV